MGQDKINSIIRNDSHFPTHELKAHAVLMAWKDGGISFTNGKLVQAFQEEGLGRLAKKFSSQVNIWCSVTYNKNTMNIRLTSLNKF